MGKCINYFKTYTLKDGEIEYIGGICLFNAWLYNICFSSN